MVPDAGLKAANNLVPLLTISSSSESPGTATMLVNCLANQLSRLI